MGRRVDGAEATRAASDVGSGTKGAAYEHTRYASASRWSRGRHRSQRRTAKSLRLRPSQVAEVSTPLALQFSVARGALPLLARSALGEETDEGGGGRRGRETTHRDPVRRVPGNAGAGASAEAAATGTA